MNKEIKDIVAENLYNLRIKRNMTQIELASKMNYTDKAISKWEHGDATPPIDVLKKLADIYGVSLDFLVSENNDYIDKVYRSPKNTPNKIIITLLAVSLIWLIATVLYVYGEMLAGENLWIFFIIAVPISMVVLLVFNTLWGRSRLNYIIISVGIWSSITSIFCYFIENCPWMIFFIGVPLQVVTILWSQLKPSKRK